MSLEECKRIAEKREERIRTHTKIKAESRHAEGWVDDGWVSVDFYAEHIGRSYQTWIVAVFSRKHTATSKKTFQMQMKKLAVEYFEDLVLKYGFTEWRADG